MNSAAEPGTSLLTALAHHRTLGLLPEPIREALSRALSITEIPPGGHLSGPEPLRQHLHWLLEGRAALLDADGEVVVQLMPGEFFGLGLGQDLGVHAARAETACRCVRIDALTVQSLARESPALAYLLPPVADEDPPGLRTDARTAVDPALNLMATPVGALVRREPVTLPPDTRIQDAARVMREQRVSSVLIVEQGLLFGLITDRDLRNRVIAAGLDTAQPIADIATLAPMSIDRHSPAFDALLLMARHNIHHVPVMDGQRIAGMITATDLTEQHSTSAVYLAGDIHKQTTVDGLRAAAVKVQRLQQGLAAAQASAHATGHIVTAITDAITSRLLQLAEARLGPPPVDYVWIAAGSQARSEQTARSDQDNCLLLDDAYDPAAHGDYFRDLATFVCDGLDACGYVYCPGEMMAMTGQWRQPRRKWTEYFARWTGQPDPTALMLTCVFFDLRAIHGHAALLDSLRQDLLQRTRGNSMFLAHMVSNALLHPPPLGLFKGISAIRSGEHKGAIDLKHTGVVPIVDLARVYALAVGDPAVNTHDRLVAAAAAGALGEQSSRDLCDALEFLAFLRLQHQARLTGAGKTPDNYLHLDELSNFERTQLKDAFAVVAAQQNALGQRYQAGRF